MLGGAPPIDPYVSPDLSPTASLTQARISLGALQRNARLVRQAAGEAELLAVVKADAYGHGAVPVAHALRAVGVRRFGVATLAEAHALRAGGIEEAILVFAAPLPEQAPAYRALGVEMNVASEEAAALAAGMAAPEAPLRVHVKVDTGMHRLGIAPERAAAVVRRLEAAPGVVIEGLWTHFADADADDLDFTRRQLERFDRVVREVGDAAAHLHTANSAALFRAPEALGYPRALVRPGLALYGLTCWPDEARSRGLEPVMQFATRLTLVKTVAAGESVSYGRRWRAARPTRIGTLAAGYADGYPRALTGKSSVGVSERLRPVAGVVCMDMCMVDLGDAPAAPGDEVVLWGPGGPSAAEVARWAGTIPYELTCGVSARVPRLYTSGEAPTL